MHLRRHGGVKSVLGRSRINYTLTFCAQICLALTPQEHFLFREVRVFVFALFHFLNLVIPA